MSTAPRSDRKLVLAAQAGDERARDALVRRYLPLVYNIVGRALSGRPDVDDVVQDCMLRIVRDLPQLREPSRLRAWAGSIAVARISSYRAELEAHAFVPLESAPEDGVDFEGETILRLELSGQRREVVEATRWLDPGERLVLSLWWLEAAGQISRAELAQMLDTTVAYAGVRVQRMRAQLDTCRSVVAALDQRGCPGMWTVLDGWDGRPGPLWRKRIARHVRDCPMCDRDATARIAPERLLLGCALVPAPAALGGKLTIAAGGGSGPATPGRVARRLRSNPVAAAVTAVALVAAAAVAYARVPESQEQPVGQIVAATPSSEAPAPVPSRTTATRAAPKPSPTSSPTPSPSPSVKALSRRWANWPMPAKASYKVKGETVHDTVTGLVWQRGFSKDALPWAQAKQYCADLDLAGGGWHLPTRIELTSIVDHGRYQPAIDVDAFPGTPPKFFWSSTPWVVSPGWAAWTFNFFEGLTSNAGRLEGLGFARCVRSGNGSGDPDYRISKGQVTDPTTGLVWQRTGPTGVMSPQAATAYCAGLSLAGHGDWRLPSVKEIATTVDDKRVRPAIDISAFPNTVGNGWYWTSTPSGPEPGKRWALNYDDGYTNYRKATEAFVRCVR
ncbi:sigma-70 family RNA polymerase sigma factor [Actinoplanes sp. NPDC000266]